MTTTLFIPTAEAAFIANLTDRQMHRVVDEHLVPKPLMEHHSSHRQFTRLGAALANFYFATEDLLVAGARRQVLDELGARVEALQAKDKVLTLTLTLLDSMSWKVERKHVEIDVFPFVQAASFRAKEVERADSLVESSPDVMGGMPVFAGTRVPVSTVLGSLEEHVPLARLKASYPFLTEAHIQAAKVYCEVHPRRGRPRRLVDVNPALTPRSSRIIERTAKV